MYGVFPKNCLATPTGGFKHSPCGAIGRMTNDVLTWRIIITSHPEIKKKITTYPLVIEVSRLALLW